MPEELQQGPKWANMQDKVLGLYQRRGQLKRKVYSQVCFTSDRLGRGYRSKLSPILYFWL